MAGFIARHWRLSCLCIPLTLLALPVSSAAAPGPYPSVTVGPIAAAHGFKVEIFSGCNVRGAAFGELVMTKRGRRYTLTYDYYPRKGDTTCTASKRLGSGKLSVRWGRALSGHLKFGQAGGRKPIREKGCTGPSGHYRKVRGTGSLKMAIHTKVFGKLVIHSAPAEIEVYDENPTCTPAGGAGSYTTFYAAWDGFRRTLDASDTPGGHRITDVFAQDNSAAVAGSDVIGRVQDVFRGGSKLFSFRSDLSSAHLGSISPLLSGGLKYTATSSCGPDYTAGTLTGKLVVHDPVLGPLRFVGSKVSERYGGPALDTGATC
ncbi:MAG TPA: hypothetical protein VG405_10910 [Solirubrobacteraceae bacterium]|nr:hypothetical protein [Solirubrobacteraceae bacterium]